MFGTLPHLPEERPDSEKPASRASDDSIPLYGWIILILLQAVSPFVIELVGILVVLGSLAGYWLSR